MNFSNVPSLTGLDYSPLQPGTYVPGSPTPPLRGWTHDPKRRIAHPESILVLLSAQRQRVLASVELTIS